MVRDAIRRHAGAAALSLAAALPLPARSEDAAPATIVRVKASIVAVGTFERLRNPSFAFAGTGFVVGDGLQVVTNSVFQLDGTAYPGNSGSPVYDAATGEVIGIVNSVPVKATRESALTQPSGITYAIPAQGLKAVLRRAP